MMRTQSPAPIVQDDDLGADDGLIPANLSTWWLDDRDGMVVEVFDYVQNRPADPYRPRTARRRRRFAHILVPSSSPRVSTTSTTTTPRPSRLSTIDGASSNIPLARSLRDSLDAWATTSNTSRGQCAGIVDDVTPVEVGARHGTDIRSPVNAPRWRPLLQR